MPQVIFRYLAKEVLITLLALTSILVLIFMSNQVIIYLNRAATGVIPGMLVVKLMMLELPNLLALLLPLGFYFALLLAYGRLYSESEMTVLFACGFSDGRLLRHSLVMASVVGCLTAFMISITPRIAFERAQLLQTTGIQTLIQTIVPGRFRAIKGDLDVFYVESMNSQHTEARHIFLARNISQQGRLHWDIVWADKARVKNDHLSGENYLVLEQGQKYQGTAGQADYEVAHFKQYQARLPHPHIAVKHDIRTVPFMDLWPLNNPDLKKAAELQWRISIPLMLLPLTLVGVALSRVNPRGGKYEKLLPAVVLCVVYANFMFISRDWIGDGKIPVWLGMWWLHLLVSLLGLWLLRRARMVR